ncbi:heparinase II/III family protein [Chitinophaga sp. GCM10012297]|uniref:Heparinase II/III family protein n=1 Tax=Chitinophaga chungangae TaxID=2821488 RepID=A0ABS3YH51_9BACT|nr:heparinase II/III family protein [Chitinophaga chungangae]MBO9154020.1 heparinase II/III family protein [Chitinophaga chungangae]
MKLTMLFLLLGMQTFAQTDTLPVGASVPGHPRILMLKGEENQLRKMIASDPVWQKMHQSIVAEADKMIGLPNLERKLEGRRLLGVSRECIRRLFYLSYAYRITGDGKYSQRAKSEMLAVAAFQDWNPSHFLDVAEMTLGMAIGYDWLYDHLSQNDRKTISGAILEKGVNTSLQSKNNNWLRVTNNWNQVCNTGMAYGALAIYEQQPELARGIINRGIKSIQLPMADYQPEGAYPEGYGYWGYGTSFNVLFISALEKIFQKDFGLTEKPGFLQTAGYLENMTGPTGAPFNYSDAGNGGGLNAAMFWFAGKQKDPSLLWVEKSWMESGKSHTRDRLLPAIMLWNNNIRLSSIKPPQALLWTGGGKNPVALMRTSWTDKNAIFAGMKGGSPSVNHAHMDVGSFVMESGGVRWAMDFGMQDYNSLESKGISIWGLAQNSQRWQVYRYNNYAHNTLTVNGNFQNVKGDARITAFNRDENFLQATTDISKLYAGDLEKAVRGIAIVNKQYVVVRDEIEAPQKETVVRWTLLTPADVKITGGNTAELSKNGKTLTLKVDAPLPVQMKTWSTESKNDYDASNKGTILTGFEMTVPAGFKGAMNVYLLPEKNTKTAPVKALSEWPASK